MAYKTPAEIFNAVFDSSSNSIKAVSKTEGEVLNLIYDPENAALRVMFSDDSKSSAGSVIDGEAATYADLPEASEHTGEIYIVQKTTGVYLINRKQAGMYRSDGSVWNLLDVNLQADKVYYAGTVAGADNVQDALNAVQTLLGGKLGTSDTAADSSKLGGYDLFGSGGVIDRGSNSNGEYVKFADGTLICTKNVSDTCDIIVSFFGGFRSGGITWIFPVSFAAGTYPAVFGSIKAVTAFAVSAYSQSNSYSTYQYLAVTSQASAARQAHLVAIGRWY